MFQLFLTDAVQEIVAIENKLIQCFGENIIIPGCKILIKGTEVCRRGNILLDDLNIELLGGKVEMLTLINDPDKLFATTLFVIFV